MDGEAPGYRKGPVQLDFQKLVHVLRSCRCSRKGRNDIFKGSDLGIMVQNCTRDFPEVQWLRIHTSIAGCLDLIPGREWKFHMPCGQNKTTKLHKKQKGRWRGIFFSLHQTHGPQRPSSHSGLHGTHRSDISSSCIYLLFLTTVFSDLQLGLPEFFQTLEFSKLPLLAGCETERNMPIILFFFCLSHIPQSSDIITDFRLTLSESGLRYFSSQPLKDKRPLDAAHKEPWT